MGRRSLRHAASVAAATLMIACANPSGPDEHVARLSLSFRSAAGASLLAADLLSVLGSARLTIASDKGTSTRSLTLGASDTAAAFAISVPSGSVRFTVEVVSNNQTVLFRGDTTATIDQDGFNVTVIPRAVAPFLVIAPKTPVVSFTDNGQVRSYRATWALANFGTDTLQWRVDSLATPGATSCVADDVNCFRTRPALRQSARLVQLFYTGPSQPGPVVNRLITIQSNVGTITTTVPIPN